MNSRVGRRPLTDRPCAVLCIASRADATLQAAVYLSLVGKKGWTEEDIAVSGARRRVAAANAPAVYSMNEESPVEELK